MRRQGLTSVMTSAVTGAMTMMLALPAAGQQSGTKQQPTAQQSGTKQQPAGQQSDTKQQPKPEQQKQSAASSQPVKADVRDLVRHPEKYIDKTVTVEGETIDVLGPHLFVVDAPKLVHLRGGMLVVVPEPFAAVVRRDAPVRVTGKVEKVVLAEAKRKWAFLNDAKLEVDLFEKPVLVANELTTVTPTVVSLKFDPNKPVGTSGSGAAAPITDIKQVSGASDSSLVGRQVDVSGTVVRTEGNGFWIKTASGDEVFVVPASKTAVSPGQTASVQGTVLETPRNMKDQTGQNSKEKNQPTYIYADRVAPKK
jgi:hypothetical protein